MGQNHLIKLNQELQNRVQNFALPEALGFGRVKAPIMARVWFENDRWQDPEIVACEPFQMDPFCKTLHYGQQIFEGMKAYRQPGGDPVLFRPDQNFARFNASASRMAMPTVDRETFYLALKSLVYHLAGMTPTGFGESLYLRPMMFAYDEGLSLGLSSRYLLLILASPSGSYFQTSEVKALIEREWCRAAPGGTGYVKVAGNYGSSLISGLRAKDLGFQQTLWLDAVHKQYIEEFSGMNFFAVVQDELITPELTDSILPGVTRDSIIELAREQGLKVSEKRIGIDQLVEQLMSRECQEIFACGTAAVVSPIAALGEKSGRLYEIPESFGPVTRSLQDRLMNIQYQREPGPSGWIETVV